MRSRLQKAPNLNSLPWRRSPLPSPPPPPLLLPTPPPQPRSHFASRHYLVFAVCKDNRFVWNWHRIIMTFPCGDLQQKIFWVSSKVYRPLWCRFYLCSATNHQPDYIHQQGHKKCGWYRGRFYIYTFFVLQWASRSLTLSGLKSTHWVFDGTS